MKKPKILLFAAILLTALVLNACAGKPASVPDSIYEQFYSAQNDEGMAAIEEFLKANPDHAAGLALRSTFHTRLENDEAALADANRAIELDPELAWGYAARAYVFSYSEDQAGFAADLKRALELDPNLALGYSLRANSHLDLGEFSEAEADFKKAIELQPNYIAPNILLGDALMAQEKYEEAIKQYDGAAELFDKEPYIFLQRGYAKLNSGDAEGAKADFEKVIETGGEAYPETFILRAFANESLGDTDAALADYEKAIDLGVEDSTPYNNAAYIIALSDDGDYQKALEYVNKALELEDPDESTTLDTQAFVYYRLGENDKALKIFSQIIDGGETYSYYGRGLVYEENGDKENAISDFKAFLEAYPDDPNSADAQKRLDALLAQ